jgi:hypothetical protein
MTATGPKNYPWRALEVGHGFTVPPQAEGGPALATLHASCSKWSRVLDRKFKASSNPDGSTTVHRLTVEHAEPPPLPVKRKPGRKKGAKDQTKVPGLSGVFEELQCNQEYRIPAHPSRIKAKDLLELCDIWSRRLDRGFVVRYDGETKDLIVRRVF